MHLRILGFCFTLLLCVVNNAHALSDVKGEFGSWSVICGQQNCSMTQLVTKDKEAKQVLLGVSINYAFNSDLGTLVVRLPANISKESGLGIKIDKRKPIQVAISQCNLSACQSVIRIDDILLKEFTDGNIALFAFATRSKKQMTLPISLSSFEQAYNELKVHQQLMN